MEENINIDEEEENNNIKIKFQSLNPKIKKQIKNKLLNIFHNIVEKRYLLRMGISFQKWKGKESCIWGCFHLRNAVHIANTRTQKTSAR